MTLLEQIVDQPSTPITLSGNGGSISNSAISINLSSTATLTPAPTSGQFVRCAVDQEEMWITAVNSSTNVTVLRGQNGTTAASHNDGAACTPFVDNAFLNNLLQQVQLGTANGPASLDANGHLIAAQAVLGPGSYSLPAAPSSTLTAGSFSNVTFGTAVTGGAHSYYYEWVTPAGRGALSGATTVTFATITDPSTVPTATAGNVGANGLAASTRYDYRYAFNSVCGPTNAPSAVNATATTTSTNKGVTLSGLPSLPTGCTSIIIYRQTGGAGSYFQIGTTTSTSFVDDGKANGAVAPTSNTSGYQTLPLTIPAPPVNAAGSTDVIFANIYRQAGSGTKYFLTQVPATTNTYTDLLPDSSLTTAYTAPSGTTATVNLLPGEFFTGNSGIVGSQYVQALPANPAFYLLITAGSYTIAIPCFSFGSTP